MKRFYKLVSVSAQSDGFSICLDGKPVKMPSRELLLSSTQALADEIVIEWVAQEKNIMPDEMPLTQILTTALDRVTHERAAMEMAVLAYLDTDLVCYRASQPESLAQKQAEIWDSWLDWFEKTYAVRLDTTMTLQALKQTVEAHSAVKESVNALDRMNFTVLQLVTSLSGSLVLALAFVAGEASPDQVFEAAHIEESCKADIYNEEFYGMAPLQEKKQNAMKRDLAASRKFLDLL